MLLRGTRHSSCIRPRMEIGGPPVHGRARAFPKKERESRIYIYIYTRTTKKICHVTRRGPWNEDDQIAVNRRGGKKRQRQMQESRKRSSCTLCTQLSSLFFPLRCWLLRSDSTRLYPSLGYQSSAAPSHQKETIRVAKYLDPCTLRKTFLSRLFLRAIAWNLEFWMRVLWDNTREILTRNCKENWIGKISTLFRKVTERIE